MSFQRTTAINKILALTKRKKALQGSTGAGKTHGVIPILIDRAAKATKQNRLKITVTAETIPALKDGCVDIFKSVMQDTGRWVEDRWIGSPMEYTFWNGSKMQFKSFDTIGKAKASGKRDILFINEANHIPYSIADMLITRSREIYIDFNADEEFWVHTEILTEDDAELLVLTFDDNEALPLEIYQELMIKKRKAFYDTDLEDLFKEPNVKSHYWANWWLVYGMGEVGSYSERRIYNFTIVDEIPEGIKRVPSGMDFGQSPDPTCLIDAYVEKSDLYLDQVFSENNLLEENIPGADRMSITDKLEEVEFEKNWQIIGDSSGRTALLTMRSKGYNARGVKKYQGSVKEGIKRLRSYDIRVTRRSTELINGLQNWFFKVDPNGKIIPEPATHEPDGLAAARYIALSKAIW